MQVHTVLRPTPIPSPQPPVQLPRVFLPRSPGALGGPAPEKPQPWHLSLSNSPSAHTPPAPAPAPRLSPDALLNSQFFEKKLHVTGKRLAFLFTLPFSPTHNYKRKKKTSQTKARDLQISPLFCWCLVGEWAACLNVCGYLRQGFLYPMLARNRLCCCGWS